MHIGGWCCDFNDDVAGLAGFGAANRESIAELLTSFFYYWVAQHDFRHAVVTIRQAAPLSKSAKGWCGADMQAQALHARAVLSCAVLA